MRYKDYIDDENINICCDNDNELYTLEKHILNVNNIENLNRIFNTSLSESKLLKYMIRNKTECALRIFECDGEIEIPEYINEVL